jgi:glycosyltransferase involved in cell wall biosynthesis
MAVTKGNKSKQPLVSVLVPVYNGENFLDEALASVRRQTHRNLEILIRDNASTDGTLQIARAHAAKDPRIQVIAVGENEGALANYSALLKAAQGEYIKVCNHDDLLESTCVQLLLRPMTLSSRVIMASSIRQLIDTNGEDVPERPFNVPLSMRHTVLPGEDVMRHVVTTALNQIGEPSTVLFRSGVIDPDDFNVFDGHRYVINADVAMWMSLLTSGDLYWHAAPLSSFRIHADQGSADARQLMRGRLEWAELLLANVASGLISIGETRQTAQRISDVLAMFRGNSERSPAVVDFFDEIDDMQARLAALYAPVGV